MSEAVLQVDGLHKAFGGVQAVEDVSFAVSAGELLALIGPNGAGKSTCFNMLNGQLAPDSGIVRLEGRDIVGLSPRAIWRLGVGRTFQITATFASLSVRENVQMALYSHAGRLSLLSASVATCARGRCAARSGRHARPGRSGLRRAGLWRPQAGRARHGARQPAAPAADGRADRRHGAARAGRLMELTARLARAAEIAVLFTEHDMDVVFSQADRIIVLDRGRLIAGGLPAEVRANPRRPGGVPGGGH
jgi:branched-chain amino acid transport system ATP-binding protein